MSEFKAKMHQIRFPLGHRYGSVPIRRNTIRRNPTRRNPNPNDKP